MSGRLTEGADPVVVEELDSLEEIPSFPIMGGGVVTAGVLPVVIDIRMKR
jgi:hypothetical protein